MGVSPRASLALMKAAQALALFDGMDFLPMTVKAHRLKINPQAYLRCHHKCLFKFRFHNRHKYTFSGTVSLGKIPLTSIINPRPPSSKLCNQVQPRWTNC